MGEGEVGGQEVVESDLGMVARVSCGEMCQRGMVYIIHSSLPVAELQLLVARKLAHSN